MVSVKYDKDPEEQIKKNFRELFDEYTETLIYREQVAKFNDVLNDEMKAVHDKIEHPNV